MSTSVTDQFSAFVDGFTAGRPPTEVDGEYYDLPGVAVYRTYTQPLAGKGRVEINTVTPNAAGAFEWATEITINDKAGGRFIHLIIRPDRSCAETYGKTVLPIEAARGAEILAVLRELAPS